MRFLNHTQRRTTVGRTPLDESVKPNLKKLRRPVKTGKLHVYWYSEVDTNGRCYSVHTDCGYNDRGVKLIIHIRKLIRPVFS
jgi:hypothetical protein